MFLSRAQVRDYDRRAADEYGMPSILLMENAGRGAAECLLRRNPERKPVVICCGKGNNGGDGFVIARHLDNAAVPVDVVLIADPGDLTGDAAVMHDIVARTHIPITRTIDLAVVSKQVAAAAWLVDALLGTGLTGAVRPPYDGVIDIMNAAGVPIFAVDIPSGLDGDTGRPLGPTIRASLTATFVAQKTGFASPSAKPFLGEVHVIDIGAPRPLLAKVASDSPHRP